MEKEDLKRQVEMLRIHKDLQRMFVSDAVKDMICFIDQNINEDGLIMPPDKKKNPWDNSRKCAIL